MNFSLNSTCMRFQITRPLLPPSSVYNFPNRNNPVLQKRLNSSSLSDLRSLTDTYSLSQWSSRSASVRKCVSEKSLNSFESDRVPEELFGLTQEIKENGINIMKILKGVGSFLPHVALASSVLALIYPRCFTWFTSKYYAPALGFLMFAVGVNSSEKDFVEALNRPAPIVAGYVGQFIVKPFLGYLIGTLAVTVFNLPTSVGAGIMLAACVSGAQLSNYATFLIDPQMAPLSIVMTSLSTATAVFVTPTLSLLLIGKRLPIDVMGMVASIMQIVVAPVATGLFLNRFFPWICDAIRPFLPLVSVFLTALCNGSPLASNVDAVLSPFGLTVLLLVLAFHTSAFVAGYVFPGLIFRKDPDVKALQRTISLETGMQSSLLALALANRFFPDPLVGVAPAISVVVMSLMGFSLVMIWSKLKELKA